MCFSQNEKKPKKIFDPIVDVVVGLIRPHVKPFHNEHDGNEDIAFQMTTGMSIKFFHKILFKHSQNV